MYKSTWWPSTTTTKSWFQTAVHTVYPRLPWCYNLIRCHLHLITKCREHLSLYSSDRKESKHIAEDIAAMGWVADIKKRSRMCAEHHQRSAQGREAHAQSPRVSWIIVKVAAEGYLAISLIRPRAVKFTDTRSTGAAGWMLMNSWRRREFGWQCRQNCGMVSFHKGKCVVVFVINRSFLVIAVHAEWINSCRDTEHVNTFSVWIYLFTFSHLTLFSGLRRETSTQG